MLALPVPVPAQSAEPAALLRQRLETLQGDPAATLRGTSVSAVPFLLELYARRNFTPAWTNAQRIDEFIAILEGTDAEGLDPDDYHAALLRDMQQIAASGGQAQATADFDVLLTDALVRLGTHLRFGKVDPVRLDSN